MLTQSNNSQILYTSEATEAEKEKEEFIYCNNYTMHEDEHDVMVKLFVDYLKNRKTETDIEKRYHDVLLSMVFNVNAGSFYVKNDTIEERDLLIEGIIEILKEMEDHLCGNDYYVFGVDRLYNYVNDKNKMSSFRFYVSIKTDNNGNHVIFREGNEENIMICFATKK